jgi:hypothetical protein
MVGVLGYMRKPAIVARGNQDASAENVTAADGQLIEGLSD